MGKTFRRDVNYYQILQVDPEADPMVIKSAYYTLLNQMKGHPDKGGDEENAKLINEAYHILSNKELREEYDHFLLGAPQQIEISPTWNHNNARVTGLHPPRNRDRGFFWKELFPNEKTIDEWFNDFLGWEREPNTHSHLASHTPPMNIYRTEKNFCIKLEIPGVKWEDIHIKFEGGILTVYGDKMRENRNWIKMEFQYGPFIRSIKIPDQVIPDRISASLKEGILEIIVPISEKKKRVIPITQL